MIHKTYSAYCDRCYEDECPTNGERFNHESYLSISKLKHDLRSEGWLVTASTVFCPECAKRTATEEG